MQIHNAIRLLQETCALHHTALSTEKSYTYWLQQYARFLKGPQRKPLLTTEAKIESFLTHLALQGVSASTQNQAFNALLFFYRIALRQELGNINALRVKRPASLRYCPDRGETLRLLAEVKDIHGYPTRLLVHLLYACGLRVCEPLNLRIKDLDLKERQLHIYQAKGNKGRVVQFPECLTAALERQLSVAKAMHARDLTERVPVALPGLLAKKYPYAQYAERWAWLFPSKSICRDPRAKKLVRWRCHESNVQRAVRDAALRCNLQGITPHNLRHAFATHALHDGAFVRDLQVVMGHTHLDTTMNYLHPEAARVTSPLKAYTDLAGSDSHTLPRIYPVFQLPYQAAQPL
jgi:site-specific recombinase XerD